jgi:pimeloyl-ACP methyl ester carboxylesterase
VLQPRSHAFDANGIRLVVHDWGGDGSPVLLAHPTGFHGRIWAPIAERLVGRGHRVHSFDFRGHGDSEAPDPSDESYSWSGFADDALAVTRHLGLESVADLLACGHSKGGASLVLGEQRARGTYPRIWTYEPIMFPGNAAPVPNEEFPLSRAARKRRNEWASVEEAYEAYASKPPFEVMQPDALRAYVEYGLRDRGDGVFELKCRPEVEARVYAMGPMHGAYERLHDVEPPVLVVCGESSRDISPEFGGRIADRMPRGALEVMAGCGHFGPQQDADATVASMVRFASETADRATPA